MSRKGQAFVYFLYFPFVMFLARALQRMTYSTIETQYIKFSTTDHISMKERSSVAVLLCVWMFILHTIFCDTKISFLSDAVIQIRISLAT